MLIAKYVFELNNNFLRKWLETDLGKVKSAIDFLSTQI